MNLLLPTLAGGKSGLYSLPLLLMTPEDLLSLVVTPLHLLLTPVRLSGPLLSDINPPGLISRTCRSKSSGKLAGAPADDNRCVVLLSNAQSKAMVFFHLKHYFLKIHFTFSVVFPFNRMSLLSEIRRSNENKYDFFLDFYGNYCEVSLFFGTLT